MGRAKQYDRTNLLDRAVELFRRHGFNGTSTAELVAELGVNRKSMYAEFGSKQGSTQSSRCSPAMPLPARAGFKDEAA